MQTPALTEVRRLPEEGRMRLTWSDGHGTGIYRFDFLREICPCEKCGGVPQEMDV